MEGAITRESYEQFCNRVQQTIVAVPVATIDRIIESMDGRLRQIIDQNGERLTSVKGHCQFNETSKRFQSKIKFSVFIKFHESLTVIT